MFSDRQLTVNATLANVFALLAYFLLDPIPLFTQEAGGGGQSPEIMLGEMREIARVRPQNHPGLGRWSAELGDINGDGYDDFAVSSYFDTTFIFLGGDTINWEPYTFVMGGSAGLRAADLNRDGHIDIVTSEFTDLYPDPLGRPLGRIRCYLSQGKDRYFSDPPDLVLRGEYVQSGYWGDNMHGRTQSIELIDFNGDDQFDLLFTKAEWGTNLANHVLGSSFNPKNSSKGFGFYYESKTLDYKPNFDHLVGDINGDGRTDILISCRKEVSLRDTSFAWDIFLGRDSVKYKPADFKLRSDSSWYFDKYFPAISDINNDGCDEIFPNRLSREYGHLPFFRGRQELTNIEPDDSLVNPSTSTYQSVVSINPVGDLNGDGTRDLIVGYTRAPFQRTTAFHCYPNIQGAGHRYSTGGFAVDSYWHEIDVTRTYPAGDVNGDGYDDVLVLARGWSLASRNGFIIFSGSAKLLGVSPSALPSGSALEVYPNPVRAGGGDLHIRVTAQTAEQSMLEIHDITGRRVYSRQQTLVPGAQQITVKEVTLQPGYYTIVLTGRTRSTAGVVCQ